MKPKRYIKFFRHDGEIVRAVGIIPNGIYIANTNFDGKDTYDIKELLEWDEIEECSSKENKNLVNRFVYHTNEAVNMRAKELAKKSYYRNKSTNI